MKVHRYLEYIIDITAVIIVIEAFLRFVGISDIQPGSMKYVDYTFIVILLLDLLYRFKQADNKRLFIKEHYLEFVSLIPFWTAFRLFRIFRIIRKSRFNQFLKTVHGMLKSNGMYYVILVVLILALVGGGLLFRLEEDIDSLGDGIWFSFVTMTTVGYGDFTPTSPEGRLIALLLMFIGIGFLGVLTGSIASYFTKRKKQTISDRIDIGDLTNEEKEQVNMYIEFIRSKK